MVSTCLISPNLTMNKNRLFAVITVLVLCATMLAGCGKSEFGLSENEEEVPDTEAEAIITANISGADGASGTVEPGSYMLRATCTEKATGTVVVEVTPAQ